MCEPCQTPRRDPDVRIPWSKAAGLEKGRVAADEAIRTAASLPVVRQAVASLEQLLKKAQRDFRLLQGPDVLEVARLQEDLEVARGRLAALDPNATRPATVSPQPPAPAAATTAAAPPRPANATKPRVAVIMRGLHEPQSGCTAREARGCSTWKASLPAQEELLYAPLANLGCVVDVFISTDPSPRFAEMLRDYEAFANATNGSTTIAEVAAKHRKDKNSPQKPKVLAALDAVAAAGRAYDAIIVWRFDVQPLDAITTWPVRAGAVSVPFREAALREFPERSRPRPPAATAFCNRIGTNDGRISDAAWVLDGSRVRDAYDAVAKASGRLLHYAFKDGPKERGGTGWTGGIEVVAEGFYDTGQANPVFRICRSKVPCGPQADANAGRDHCEPLGAAARGETLTLEALLAGGWPAPVELVRPPTARIPVAPANASTVTAPRPPTPAAAPPPAPAKATNPARGKIFTQNPNPNRMVRPPTANVPFLGGRPVPQP